ncbi:hypothetical protein SAMN03080610_01499 [Afifella marina DSM 2698]|uniref:Uncharacterized protein n=1 Tax=Afifella marina DSM 2698 TaxID=1120955 RepID=A0A1G5N6H5_AFIMA|nr:hypothetical protein SAMN03080610_01499 [Afifella marina DSM 2698]
MRRPSSRHDGDLPRKGDHPRRVKTRIKQNKKYNLYSDSYLNRLHQILFR